MSGPSALEADVSPHFKAQPTKSLVISNVAGKNNGPGTYKRRKKSYRWNAKKYINQTSFFFKNFSGKKYGENLLGRV